MPNDPTFWVQVLIESITFAVLVVGLLGLMIPIFPGLIVMWFATLFYAIIEAMLGNMTVWDWLLFVFITILAIIGNVIDNIIIAKKVLDKKVPWSSILWGYAAGIIASIFATPLIGIIASPTGLFLAEYYRLRDRKQAFESTKAWLTGWGFSFAACFGIGVVMILLWGLWAWI